MSVGFNADCSSRYSRGASPGWRVRRPGRPTTLAARWRLIVAVLCKGFDLDQDPVGNQLLGAAHRADMSRPDPSRGGQQA